MSETITMLGQACRLSSWPPNTRTTDQDCAVFVPCLPFFEMLLLIQIHL